MKSPPKKWKWNSERVADLGWQVVGSVGPSATTPRANIFSLQKWILVGSGSKNGADLIKIKKGKGEKRKKGRRKGRKKGEKRRKKEERKGRKKEKKKEKKGE